MTAKPIIHKDTLKVTPPTWLREIEEQMIRRFIREFYSELESYLVKNLAVLGHTFSCNKEKEDLFRRITRIEFEDKLRVEYYLDFQSPENKGKLIGITNENKMDLYFSKDSPFILNFSIG